MVCECNNNGIERLVNRSMVKAAAAVEEAQVFPKILNPKPLILNLQPLINIPLENFYKRLIAPLETQSTTPQIPNPCKHLITLEKALEKTSLNL